MRILSWVALLFMACMPVMANGAEPLKETIEGHPFVAEFRHVQTTKPGKIGVLLLGGSDGGLPRPELAELIARQGNPVLSVAYFKARDRSDASDPVVTPDSARNLNRRGRV
jgi:hypothetical protein